MKFNNEKLANLCKFVTSGGTPLTSIPFYYYPKEIPWLKTGEVNYCRIHDTENYISKEGLANSSAKLIPSNSVIVAMYGQGDTAGRVAVNKIPLTTNQACCNLVINHEIADYEYVYYSLCTLYTRLVSLKNGGAQPNLNVEKIKAIEIPVPKLNIQHRIARILGVYDDLIENNQKQIKLLEEAAQRLYKEWFVDLRFPGHENVKIIDGVPEGWKKIKIADVVTVLRRGISPEYSEDGKYTVISQKCIRSSIVSFEESRKQNKKYPTELNIRDSDTVICSTGTGTLGRVGQIYGDYPATTIDSHVTLVRSASHANLLYYSIKAKQEYLMGMGRGSTNQLELYKDVIGETEILWPSIDISSQFEKMATAIHEMITVLGQKIKRCIEARDRLLPKLMLGEIEL